jgi:aspartate-semialdehyde dehydrogenase
VPSDNHAALSLERYAPFSNSEFSELPDCPTSGPIRVSLEPKWPRPVQAVKLGLEGDEGMTVHVGQISTDDRVFDLTFSFVVDNVARGAFGAALLTAEVYNQIEEIRRRN